MTRTRVRAPLAILIAVLAVAAGASAGGGGCHETTQTDSTGTSVDVGKNCFGPTILRVAVGETVTWKNFDPILHTLTAANGVFDMELAAGETYTYTFGRPGVYPYYCLLHPRMAGAVVVGDSTVSRAAAPPVQPVARLGEAPAEGTSATSAVLIAVFIAAPLSFAAGRILRGRRQTI